MVALTHSPAVLQSWFSVTQCELPLRQRRASKSPGNDYPVFRPDFGKVGFMLCWDVQYADPARALALRGAEMILIPMWGGNETLGKARAIENRVLLISSGYD
jgi:predicted amidohydrolase